MSRKVGATADPRVAITIHPAPAQMLMLDRDAARAGISRKALVAARAFAEPVEDTPALACLSRLLAIHHRLDRGDILDPALRAELLAAIKLFSDTARAEVER